MSNWELLEHNRALGVRTYIGDNPDDPEGVLVKREWDRKAAMAIIDRNKHDASHVNTGRMGDLEKVASIPVLVMYEWLTKYGVDAWKYSGCEETRQRVNKLLNDPEYRYLKCREIII